MGKDKHEPYERDADIEERFTLMDKRQYEQAFDKQFSAMRFIGALEVVGAMKYTGIPKSRYLEMLTFYEQGEYEKIRNALKGKRLDNVEEREFYLASLIELGLHEEFERYYSEFESISESCLKYIESRTKIQGYHLPLMHQAVMDYPTYFNRRYRWFVADIAADIFNLNEERLMMIDAKMNPLAIRELRDRITEKLGLISMTETFKDQICSYIDADESIPVDNVMYLPLTYAMPKDKLDDVFRRYETLSDIASFLELSRKIHLPDVETDAVSRYWKEISDAVRDGNMYITYLLACIYADTGHNKTDEPYLGREPVEEKIYEALDKEAPYIIKEIKTHPVDDEIARTLSDRGLFAYKAAGWKLCNAIQGKGFAGEAHIVCLSYLRLLEMEINEKLIYPLCESLNIRQGYEDFKSRLNDVDRDEFLKEWEYRISCLEKVNRKKHAGLRFAGIMTVFDALKFKRYKKESAHREFAGILRTELGRLLSEDGMTALADGSLLQMIAPQKLELYRDVPGDSRFSGIEMALSCKSYVERELKNLASYRL